MKIVLRTEALTSTLAKRISPNVDKNCNSYQNEVVTVGGRRYEHLPRSCHLYRQLHVQSSRRGSPSHPCMIRQLSHRNCSWSACIRTPRALLIIPRFRLLHPERNLSTRLRDVVGTMLQNFEPWLLQTIRSCTTSSCKWLSSIICQ